MTAWEDVLFETLLDPDEVGTSEYRALYGLMQDAVETANIGEDDPMRMVLAMLSEVIDTAANLSADIIRLTAEG